MVMSFDAQLSTPRAVGSVLQPARCGSILNIVTFLKNSLGPVAVMQVRVWQALCVLCHVVPAGEVASTLQKIFQVLRVRGCRHCWLMAELNPQSDVAESVAGQMQAFVPMSVSPWGVDLFGWLAACCLKDALLYRHVFCTCCQTCHACGMLLCESQFQECAV